MKSFILIFVSLFFLNAQAGDTENSDSNSNSSNFLQQLIGDRKSIEAECADAKKEKLEKVRDIKDKIDEITEKQSDAKKDLIEEINKLDAAISDADIAYKKERADIQKEINEMEDKKDTTFRDLSKKIETKIQDLKKIIITNRNAVERDYQQNLKAAYAQCNIIAQKDLKDRIAADREQKRAQNQGLINSGGAGFNGNTSKKIKAAVQDGYNKCIAMAQETLKNKRTGQIEILADDEAATQAEIRDAHQELADYIDKRYPKEAADLNDRLNTAYDDNMQKKNSLAQQKQALQQALQDKMVMYDGQINARRAELINKKSTKHAPDSADVTAENLNEIVSTACCNADGSPKTVEVPDGKDKTKQVPINAGGSCKGPRGKSHSGTGTGSG